jgi:alpha-L-fucosidase
MIPHFGDGRDWFFERRFGLFIHWGLYALGEWHEQEQFRRPVPRLEYARQIERFNPVKFDPDQWLDLAESVGMRYVTFTSKHVDGFCMFDSAHTDYKVTNTPYGRDVLGMLAEACHRRDIALCIYYSVADMHHPNYPNAGRSYELPAPAPEDEPDLDKYLAYVEAQVRELCTNYGTIHGFWWDANVMQHLDPRFRALIRSLQPQAAINGRGFDGEWPAQEGGDFNTPERDYDRHGADLLAFERPTEACQAVGIESWGYRAEEDYYTDAYLIRSIDRMMARGANYLLNVGPKADGTFPDEAVRMLRVVGDWYQRVQEGLVDVVPASDLTINREVLLTRRDNTLYVHLHTPPRGTAVLLAPLAKLPRAATLLNTGEAVQTRLDRLPERWQDPGPSLRLYNLPVNEHPDTALVVKLEFDGDLTEG